MKKKNFYAAIITLMIVAPTLIISSHTIDATIQPPIDLTTLDYLDYEYILIPNNNWVNLTYINSEYTPASLTMEKIEYYDNYPSDNETKYKFTSNTIDPDHTFIAEIKTYTFQDSNTGQLYTVNIDFSNVDVPLSPLQIQYTDLMTNFSDLQTNYTLFLNDYNNLTNLIININDTLSNYNNSGDIDLEDKTIMITNDYDTLTIEIDTITNQLDTLTDQHNQLTNQYENLTIEYTNMSDCYVFMNTTYLNMTTRLNQTLQDLNETKTNLTYMEAFTRQLRSQVEMAYLKSEQTYIRTPYSYQNEISDKDKTIAQFPTIVIMAIVITFLLCFLFAFIKWKNIKPKDVDLPGMGYSATAQKYDNKIISVLKNTGKSMKKGSDFIFNKQPTPGPTPQPVETKTNNEPKIKDPEPTQNNEVSDKIDRLLAGMGSIKTDVGTVKKDLGSIHDRLDTVEKKVKIKTPRPTPA